MNADERLTTTSDERLATANLARDIKQTRGLHEQELQGRQEGAVLKEDGGGPVERVAASPGAAAAIRQESSINQESRIKKDKAPQAADDRQTWSGLFEEDEARRLRTRWTDIQGGFVDEPRRAVKEADALVADAVKRLADVFANERNELERQWDSGDNVTTEDLRLALRRYHAFFDRLLSI